MTKKEGFILSCRCMCDFAIFGFRSLTSNQCFIFEFPRNDENKIEHQEKLQRIRELTYGELIVGWGNHTYDLPLLTELLKNETIFHIYKQNKILKHASYKKQAVETQDKNRNYLDLALFSGQTSDNATLNLIAARLHTKIIFNEFSDDLVYTREYQRKLLRTEIEIRNNQIYELFNHLLPQIHERKILGAEYNLNLLNQSSPRAVESIFKEYFIKNQDVQLAPKANHVKYKKSPLICFKTEFMQRVLPFIEGLNFEINKQEGNIKCPTSFFRYKITMNKAIYSLGLGGLHSNEKKTYALSDDEYRLFLCDVKSYYPSLIMQLGICPDVLKSSAIVNKRFTEFYENLITKKYIAEQDKDNRLQSIIKLILNSIYGKLGQSSSILYSPEQALNIAITGQLTLLMLIEALESNRMQVISANTDGLIVKIHKYYIGDFKNMCLEWELTHSLKLKHRELKAVFFRNVNNYFAQTIDGDTIRKGVFTKSNINKNPCGEICFRAVINYVTDNVPIRETVRNFKKIEDYLFCRFVTGGCYAHSIDGSSLMEKHIGQVARYIYSHLAGNYVLRSIKMYKVPSAYGVYIGSNLDNISRDDIHYEKYEEIANNLLEDILQNKC